MKKLLMALAIILAAPGSSAFSPEIPVTFFLGTLFGSVTGAASYLFWKKNQIEQSGQRITIKELLTSPDILPAVGLATLAGAGAGTAIVGTPTAIGSHLYKKYKNKKATEKPAQPSSENSNATTNNPQPTKKNKNEPAKKELTTAAPENKTEKTVEEIVEPIAHAEAPEEVKNGEEATNTPETPAQDSTKSVVTPENKEPKKLTPLKRLKNFITKGPLKRRANAKTPSQAGQTNNDKEEVAPTPPAPSAPKKETVKSTPPAVPTQAGQINNDKEEVVPTPPALSAPKKETVKTMPPAPNRPTPPIPSTPPIAPQLLDEARKTLNPVEDKEAKKDGAATFGREASKQMAQEREVNIPKESTAIANALQEKKKAKIAAVGLLKSKDIKSLKKIIADNNLNLNDFYPQDDKASSGKSLLAWAIDFDNKDAVKDLLKVGASKNGRVSPTDRRTPLQYATDLKKANELLNLLKA